MIQHPYGASSYMYASVNDQYGSASHTVYSRDPLPQHFQSFIPRFSTESLQCTSQNGTIKDTNGSPGYKHISSADVDSLSPPKTFTGRIWRTLRVFGGSVSRRWPLRNFSFVAFIRPCHYQLPDNDSVPDSREQAARGQGEHILPDSVNELLAELGNTDYLNALLELADAPIASASRTSREEQGTGPRNSASRVALDYFDPGAVDALLHRLSMVPDARRKSSPIKPGAAPETPSQGPRLAETSRGHFDLESVLRDLLKRRDEADIRSRNLGVLFDQLRVVGKGAPASFQKTLGSILNPLNFVHFVQRLRHPELRDIIDGFQGVVNPSEMLLVLGRPGSGCSTFLKVLANRRREFHSVEGHVWYNSFTPADVRRHYRGDVQYCPEEDVLFPTLTVEQTIGFAAMTREPRARVRDMSQREFWTNVVDILLTVFGLRHVRTILVGDDAAIRGISGGEKKRVLISETLATRSQVTCWDNSTRGLDASTAVEYVHALWIATNLARMVTIVSLYQANESLYDVFDKVCVIYEGRMVYFGPANQARQFFIDMGYEPANRQTTSDFLVAVTDPDGRKVRNGMRGVPSTAVEFERYYRRSSVFQANREEMAAFRERHIGKSASANAERESVEPALPKRTPYTMSIPMQIGAAIVQRTQIKLATISNQVVTAVIYILEAIILGTTFFQLSTDTTAFYSRTGILFLAVFLPILFAMAEIPSMFTQRPIVEKHYRAAMYHPFTEAIALTLVDIPFTFIIITLFSVILYFLVSLQRSAGQLFTFLLFEFLTSLMAKALFRGLAAAFSAEAPAQTVAGILMLIVSLYAGYVIPPPAMIGALHWLKYINPLGYSFESLMVNEFHTINGLCGDIIPSGPLYDSYPESNKACATVGSQSGDIYVDGNRYVNISFGYSYGHLWRNLGILIAFVVFFIALLAMFSEFNTIAVGRVSATLFKRGSRSAVRNEPTNSNFDEEKTRVQTLPVSEADDRRGNKEDTRDALARQPRMQNTFSWEHVNYHIANRRLLHDVSGFVRPGKLTALMGESGTETTLLNVLAERVETGVVSGTRLINGQPLPLDFQAQTGYCQQMDTCLRTMTVRESLLFSAKLRQPFSVPNAEKEAYVDKCLTMCGLDAHRDAIVGSLRAEMKRRTTIGVELAAKPKLLLFPGEPTSGLDSQGARAIVSFLRELPGQAILCTIHQPSAELFQIFDRLVLLRKGGETVYFGDIGPNSTTLVQYFEGNGSRACTPTENPAEFILDVIDTGVTAENASDWHQIWTNSPEAALVQSEIDAIIHEGRNESPVAVSIGSGFATPWVYQVYTILVRNLQHHWRDPTYLMAKLMLNIVGGLVIGFTFFKRHPTIEGTLNQVFAVFIATILSVPIAIQAQVIFLRFRDVYEIRERPSRTYSWTALITSQILVELPWNVVGSTLFFVCWYWTVGFPTSRAAFTFLLMGFLFPLYYTTIGEAVATISPNAEVAAIIFSFLISFVLTLSGIIQPYSQLGWWKWMYRVSPYTYLLEALVTQALHGQAIQCAPEEFAVVQPPSGYSCASYLQPFADSSGGYVENPDAGSDCLYCPDSDADQWLAQQFHMNYSHRWKDVGIFCAFIGFNLFMLYLLTYLFRIRSYGKSKSYVKNAITSVRGLFSRRRTSGQSQ